MSGHTPGPWTYDGTVAFSDRPDLPCVVDEYRLVVAQCWDDGHTDDECEANARLIAAAPELLEALEDAAEAFRIVAEVAEDLRMEGLESFREREAAARAAIARARGAA